MNLIPKITQECPKCSLEQKLLPVGGSCINCGTKYVNDGPTFFQKWGILFLIALMPFSRSILIAFGVTELKHQMFFGVMLCLVLSAVYILLVRDEVNKGEIRWGQSA